MTAPHPSALPGAPSSHAPDGAAPDDAAAREAALRAAARDLARHCAAYRAADARRGALGLAVTLVPLLALWGVMLWLGTLAWWAPLPLAPLAGGLLVRLFAIQHDCGHGSYFPSRRANDLAGLALSVLTVTPYEAWRRAHNAHHASSGALDKRGIGDIDTLTVAEYRALPPLKRLKYRVYRNPLVLLVIGPPLHFGLFQRFPFAIPLPLRDTWRGVMGLNLAMLALYGGLCLLIGWQAVLAGTLPMTVVAAWIGGWLFFVQHQYEGTRWDEAGEWDFHAAALGGSSYYVLPPLLNWFTADLGVHHVHHLSCRVPSYRLQECLRASPALQSMSRLTLRESLTCVRLALWDEEARRLIGFGDLRRTAPA